MIRTPCTVCQRILDPFCIVSYYIKFGSSWTYSIYQFQICDCSYSKQMSYRDQITQFTQHVSTYLPSNISTKIPILVFSCFRLLTNFITSLYYISESNIEKRSISHSQKSGEKLKYPLVITLLHSYDKIFISIILPHGCLPFPLKKYFR